MDSATLSKTAPISHRQRGVSLLEIVVVVAIISIITAVAWPWYERYQQKVYRSDCIAGLQIAANDLERCGSRNGGNYRFTNPATGAVTDCPITSLTALPPPAAGGIFMSPNGRCTITPEIPLDGQTFTLTATLLAPENSNPDEVIASNALCGNLTLNSLNTRGKTAGTSTVEYCWN